VKRRFKLTPLTCGRTSAVSTAEVRPGSSVVRFTGCGWIVTTPTLGGGDAAGAAAGIPSHPAVSAGSTARHASTAMRPAWRRRAWVFTMCHLDQNWGAGLLCGASFTPRGHAPRSSARRVRAQEDIDGGVDNLADLAHVGRRADAVQAPHPNVVQCQ